MEKTRVADPIEGGREGLGRPLVSVIVALYNAQPYLKRCLDSVVKQSYKNIEIILVNDGSTDNSGEICAGYARSDSRVRVIHTKNNGPAQARNTGLDNSTGDCIFFIDADDFLEEDGLSLLVDNYNRSQADIVIADAFSVKDNILGPGHKGIFPENRILIREDIVNYTVAYLRKPNKSTLFAYSWGRLFKAAIIKDNRVCFNALLRTYEDVDFNYNYLRYTLKASFLKEPIYNHLVHNNYLSASMAVSDNPNGMLGYREALASIGRFLGDRGLEPGVIKKEVGHALICLTIIQIVRVCGQINDANRKKIYRFIREIINDRNLRENLKYYLPSKGDSRVIPFLIKLKLIWLVILVSRYKAQRRYGNGRVSK